MKRIKIILSAAIVALLSLFAFGSSFKASAASNYIDVTEYAESLSSSVYQSGGYVDTYYYIQVSETAISELVDFSEGYYIVSFAEAATSSPSGYFSPDKQFTAYSSQYNGYTFESSTVISMMNIIMPEAPTNGVAYTVAYNNTITSLNVDDEGIPYYVNHDLVACYDYRLSNSGLRESLLVAGEDFKVYYVANEDDPVIEYANWYEEKAANAGNPLLLKTDQYFEGVSINSHVISDLTYLEVPFERYLNDSELKDTQIITFAQAIYEQDGETKSELVMYLYEPQYFRSLKDLTYVDIEFELLEQEVLNSGVWMNTDVSRYSNYTDTFRTVSEVSYYNNIIKFSWSTRISDVILQPSSEGVKTTFTAKIKSFKPEEHSVSIDNLLKQDFQFFRGPVEEEVATLSVASETEAEECTYCMGYDTRNVLVDGFTVRYRFRTPSVPTIIPAFLIPGGGSNFVCQDTEYTDYFFFYFNVTDEETGIKWDDTKAITSIDVKYSIALVDIKYDSTRYAWYTKKNYDVNINYKTPMGRSINTASYSIEDGDLDYRYLSEEQILKRPELLHKKTIVPNVIEYQYPRSTFWNILKTTFGSDNLTTAKTELPTLFKTSDYDMKEFLKNAISSDGDSTGYQYGLMYGNYNGYPSISSYDAFDSLLYGNSGGNNTFYTVMLHDTANIQYVENGVKHLAKVNKTTVDNSLVEDPGDSITPDDPNYPFPVEKEKEWYEKIWEAIVKFFKVTLPNFFKKFKKVFIGILITAAVIFAIVIIIKVANFINTARAARNLNKASKNLNKKE